MTGETIGKNTKKDFTELICESCGAEFSCGASVGKCWCFFVDAPLEVLADGREKYKNCLCESCLSGAQSHVVRNEK